MLILVPLLLGMVVAAHGQDEDAGKLLQTRNVEVAKTLFQNKSFNSDPHVVDTKSAQPKSFYFSDGVRTKGYQSSGQYAAAKFWSGDMKYATADANPGSGGAFSRFLKIFKTKNADTKVASDSHLAFESGVYPMVREYRGKERRGMMQDQFDKEGAKALTGKNSQPLDSNLRLMSIDDVRKLLNESK